MGTIIKPIIPKATLSQSRLRFKAFLIELIKLWRTTTTLTKSSWVVIIGAAGMIMTLTQPHVLSCEVNAQMQSEFNTFKSFYYCLWFIIEAWTFDLYFLIRRTSACFWYYIIFFNKKKWDRKHRVHCGHLKNNDLQRMWPHLIGRTPWALAFFSAGLSRHSYYRSSFKLALSEICIRCCLRAHESG